MASASATVNVEALLLPARTPFCVLAPGRMTNRLVPRLAICRRTASLAPSPSAIIAIKAATPMKTPSIVRTARSLLRASAAMAALSVMEASDQETDAPAGGGRGGGGGRPPAAGRPAAVGP